MSLDVSVIIVNFNAGAALAACLASLARGLAGLSWNAIVVDNASADGSERAAGDTDPRVRLVRMPRNVGFAAAANRGARESHGRVLLFLNPDCELLGGGMGEGRLRVFETDPTCAALGPGIVSADGSLQGSARGDPSMLTGLFGRSTWLTARFPHWRIARHNVVPPALDAGEDSRLVDWVSGACMLVRRTAFDAVGGFDERYFLFWEDADLCRRLRAAGYTVRYAPAVGARHSVGASRRSARSLAIREFHRSAYRYYATWSGTRPWSPRRAVAFVALGMRCAVQLLTGARPGEGR
jgi:N-acetylglucosaminyl-diphospho-decaprenol L-rhamnosyltransferase